MGVSLELINFNDLFYRQAKHEPVIINDYSEGSEEEREAFNKLIYTKYVGDLLSNLPSCECTKTAGAHLIGIECPECHKLVTAPLEQDLEPLVWIRHPIGVKAMMNPIVWTMLKEKFTKSGFEIIRWLSETTYRPTVKMPLIMDSVLALGIPRGYNNFVENFDEIMKQLFDLKGFRQKKGVLDPLQEVIRRYRDCIFSDFLPLPNRSLLVIEETNVGTYVDPIVTGAVDAIRTMHGIDSPLSNHSLRTKENRTIKTIAQLADFYDGLYRTTLAKKEGIFRKHVFGTRSHFSFRGVISSMTDAHQYDELHTPWGISISLLRIHLVNKLLHKGFTPNGAIAFLNEHSSKYHPLLDELFQVLITESPYKGIPVVFQRNPSLERASAQAMFITKVKTDPDIPTITLSILSVTGFNADFDGDQLNGTLSLDNDIADQLRKLAPHMSVFDLNAPRTVSRNLSMPKPVVSTIANWIHSRFNGVETDPAKEILMEQIPEAPALV